MPRLTLDVTVVVRVACDGRELFTYVHLPEDPSSQVPRPYVHPLRTLAGEVVSLARPHDARWHRGLSFSVPRVGPHDLWGAPGPAADRGSMDHQRFTEIRERTDHVAFGHELLWHGRSRTGLDAGPELVRERRSLRVSVPAEDVWALTWESVLTNVSGEELPLGPADPDGADPGAGGLAWCGPRSFIGGTVLLPDGPASGGARAETAPWAGFTGHHDGTGAASTIVLVDDEENPGHPARWSAAATPFAAIGATSFRDGPLPFGPGETLTFRYAVVVGDGLGDVASAADLAALGRQALADAAAPPPPPTLGTFLPPADVAPEPEPVVVTPAPVRAAEEPVAAEPAAEPVDRPGTEPADGPAEAEVAEEAAPAADAPSVAEAAPTVPVVETLPPAPLPPVPPAPLALPIVLPGAHLPAPDLPTSAARPDAEAAPEPDVSEEPGPELERGAEPEVEPEPEAAEASAETAVPEEPEPVAAAESDLSDVPAAEAEASQQSEAPEEAPGEPEAPSEDVAEPEPTATAEPGPEPEPDTAPVVVPAVPTAEPEGAAEETPVVDGPAFVPEDEPEEDLPSPFAAGTAWTPAPWPEDTDGRADGEPDAVEPGDAPEPDDAESDDAVAAPEPDAVAEAPEPDAVAEAPEPDAVPGAPEPAPAAPAGPAPARQSVWARLAAQPPAAPPMAEPAPIPAPAAPVEPAPTAAVEAPAEDEIDPDAVAATEWIAEDSSVGPVVRPAWAPVQADDAADAAPLPGPASGEDEHPHKPWWSRG